MITQTSQKKSGRGSTWWNITAGMRKSLVQTQFAQGWSWTGIGQNGMADTLTKEQRSERMGLIRGRDTKPELVVRRLAHRLGYRYRLCCSDLPGKPDLVFRSRRKVIFVHGCFWHLHNGCPNNRMPKSRVDFWKPKLESNKKRDTRNKIKLSRMRWTYLVIWECETKDIETLKARIAGFLDDESN